jgi:hypothetical protein
MPVSFTELLTAFEIVSAERGADNQAYVCRQSGKVHSRMDPLYVGEEWAGELPGDIDDEEKYVAIPDKWDLDLGKPLVIDFVRQVLPEDLDDAYDMFRKKGAYARFKGLLTQRRALDQWYEFERAATERALRKWCKLNEIELAD